MYNQDEYKHLNKTNHIGNKLFIAAMIAAVCIVGIGCLGKVKEDSRQITLSSESVNSTLDA
ncbi:MAG: hypothetical protein ACI4HI_17605 [Lachnospiraceae bacterium]